MGLLDRLRAYQNSGSSGIRKETKALCGEAADEIEKLRKALQELLDDPLSDIRTDMRAGMRYLINSQ